MKTTKSRAKVIYINSIVTLFGQVLQVILGFIIRKLFIFYLGINYLGYNSVFGNLLQMLNLADLGIGVAITSFLYKPLAKGDKKRIHTLMALYKKIYGLLGLFVCCLGIIISLFLPILIPDATCETKYLRILFYINLVGTTSTYYLAYKRTLLIADQKSYMVSIIDTISYFVMSILQILVLTIKPNYIVYLIIAVGKNIVSNIIVSIKCKRIYGNLTDCMDRELLNEYKPKIKQYVKDVFVSRIGSYIFYSTDNVIISVFKGSVLTGYLSNYNLIITQVTTVVNQILSAIQATFGNYISVNEEKEKQRRMTNNYLCVNFCLGNFCMVCVMFLVQPFIQLVFGRKYLLGFSTVVLLSVNLMLMIMIQLPSQIFMIYKLFSYDRPIIVFSAATNIIVSVTLVNKFGINGVLIGTFVTSLLYLFSRFYIISKYVYDIESTYYYFKIIKYFLISAVTVIFVRLLINHFMELSVHSFVMRIILVVLSAISFPAMLLVKTEEFTFLLAKLVSAKTRKFLMMRKNWAFVCMFLCTICTIAFFLEVKETNNYTADVTNKSLKRVDSYRNENTFQDHVFHFSIDDFIYAFRDITENNYNSIFDNNTFGWLKELHDKYGIVVSCYVYYREDGFCLNDCSQKYKKEFVENSEWLRFGFHTYDGVTVYNNGTRSILKDYNMTISCLKNIVGEESIDNVIRLQSFQGSIDDIVELASAENEPIVGLLTADDQRKNYYLSADDNLYIFSHDFLIDETVPIYFYSTDLRIEFIENINEKIEELNTDAWNNQLGDFVVFTHEWILDKEIKNKVEKLCEYVNDKHYKFIFFEDIIGLDS